MIGERIGKSSSLVEDEIVVELPGPDPVAGTQFLQPAAEAEGLSAGEIGKQGALVLGHALTQDREDQERGGMQRIAGLEQLAGGGQVQAEWQGRAFG
jgi:hypothetical protein